MTAGGYPLVGPFDKNYWVSTGFLDGNVDLFRFILEKSKETYSMYYNCYTNRHAGTPTDRVSGLYGWFKRDKAHFSFRNGWEVAQAFDIEEEGMLSSSVGSTRW
ncbi:unnamed protein product [Cylicocyclus nassatus]|uniref:Uncharacterized protein n=1 Tax=Cylicocyclus nassatus TaxID=53992 RepID=A0AA36GZB5_CYLNA|nr:unnamed protein product [Cylicocyclus nassatus]